jgi:hypothetical protein
MRFPRFVPISAFILFLFAGSAGATLVVRATPEDLTEKATIIVRGEVLESKSRWTDDDRTINTYVRIRVEETLKGDAGSEVVVTCPGGTVGNSKVGVHGVPKFTSGEKVVVFGWRNKHGDLLPLGLNQGKFRIETDAGTGVEMAQNSLEGLALVSSRPAKDEASRKALREPDRLPLSDLRKRIHTRLAEVRAEEEKAKAAEAATDEAQGEAPKKTKDEATAEPVSEKPGTPDPTPIPEPEEPGKKKVGTEEKPEEESSPGRQDS